VIETKTTGAHAFIGTLKANGIDTLFGLPGSTEAPLLEALRADAEMRYVLTLQETVTVAMADGYARAGNRVGVVGLHTTVGTMNGLSQMYNAARDGSPIVVTAGHKDTGVQAADGFCAGPDLPALSRGFLKHAWQSLTSDAVGSDVRRAINVAKANPPGPTYLSIPEDIQAGAATPLSAAEQEAYTASADAHLERRPSADAISAAVRMLLDARRPILVLGATTARHKAAARALAEALELPVFAIERTQISELPYPVGDARYLGQYGEQRPLIADADCVAVINARAFFPFSSDSAAALPKGAKLIHASAEAAQIGWTIVPDVGLAGDAGPVLADLLAGVKAAGKHAPNASRGSKICARSIARQTRTIARVTMNSRAKQTRSRSSRSRMRSEKRCRPGHSSLTKRSPHHARSYATRRFPKMRACFAPTAVRSAGACRPRSARRLPVPIAPSCASWVTARFTSRRKRSGRPRKRRHRSSRSSSITAATSR
jgi:benzoylformate decarboxylase